MDIVGFERTEQQADDVAQVMETAAIFSLLPVPLILRDFRQ